MIMNNRDKEIFTIIWNAYKENCHPVSDDDYEMLSSKMRDIATMFPEYKAIVEVIMKEVQIEYQRNPYSGARVL